MHLQAEAGLFVMLDLREFLEDSSKVGVGDRCRRVSPFSCLRILFCLRNKKKLVVAAPTS